MIEAHEERATPVREHPLPEQKIIVIFLIVPNNRVHVLLDILSFLFMEEETFLAHENASNVHNCAADI